MIKNKKALQQFEKELIKKEKVDVKKNFRIVDALFYEAAGLGIIPLRNPLDGFETDSKIARVINSVTKTSRKNIRKIK
jgi:hypothetical protein